MPVEDLNAEKLGREMLRAIEASETTTEFWKNNASVLSYLAILLFFIGLIAFILLISIYTINHVLKVKRNY